MKIKEMTIKAFLDEEMKTQLEEAGLIVPEPDYTQGLLKIYNEALLPKLPRLINKKGFINFFGCIIVSAICKNVVNEMKKAA